MSSTVQIKRSNVAGKVPVAGDLAVGELGVNFADRKMYTKNPANDIIQLNSTAAVQAHDPAVEYQSGSLVREAGKIYRAKALVPPGAFDALQWDEVTDLLEYLPVDGGTITGSLEVDRDLKNRGRYVSSNFDTLTLNVSPTGSANPRDPIGDAAGSGDAFDTIASLIKWVGNRANVNTLTVNVSAGNYSSAGFTISSSIGKISILGTGISNCVNTFTSPIDCHAGELNLSEIKFVGSATAGWLLQSFGAFIVNTGTVELSTPGNYALSVKNAMRIEGASRLNLVASARALSFSSGLFYMATVTGAMLDVNTSSTGTPAIELFSGSIVTMNLNMSGPGKEVQNSGASVDWNEVTSTGNPTFIFPNSLGGSIRKQGGWSTNQTTGLCTQWGYSGVGSVIFPVAFKGDVYSISLGPFSNNTAFISNVSKTGFTLAGGYAYWTAIGY
jgi:hypothetical protein